MVIDLKKCVGCNACSVACRQEHGTPPGILYTRVLNLEVGTYPNTRFEFQPLLCMHCDNPPCEEVCPTGATHKLENGIVMVDTDKCIGCRYCMTACPYNARFFNYSAPKEYFPGKGKTAYEAAKSGQHVKGTVEKCTFCAERVEAGLEPACVVSCTAKARYFGDLDDPNSEVSKLIAEFGGQPLHAELGTKPSVYYLPG
jgi:molybdopterin-containing oxidoreductase family iron-sulfur binding subunit